MSKVFTRIDKLAVAYFAEARQDWAIRDLDIEIIVGEKLAIIGESGSGKSTLMLALAGLLPEDAHVQGTVAWPLLGRRPINGRDIGFVFQDPGASLNPVLNIGEQVAEVARRHLGLSWRDALNRAEALLGRVRIQDPRAALGAYPHQLSGGQRQRVAIAAAIAAEPTLLVADEPTSALDTVVQAEIVSLLDGLVTERGMTLLFITHDIGLASNLADRIAVLRRGSLVELGAAADIVNRPSAPYTRQLLGSYIGLDTPPLVASAA
jgi:peptide/nickel transport system ATP-binding protein